MNGSPPPPPETVAPVPIPVVPVPTMGGGFVPGTSAETNDAGINSAITIITNKAIVIFLISLLYSFLLYCLTLLSNSGFDL
jgi:hypothetical protein